MLTEYKLLCDERKRLYNRFWWIEIFSSFQQSVFSRQSCAPRSLCAPEFFDQEDLIFSRLDWALFFKRHFCRSAVMRWDVVP
jgi:hypothetical protein